MLKYNFTKTDDEIFISIDGKPYENDDGQLSFFYDRSDCGGCGDKLRIVIPVECGHNAAVECATCLSRVIRAFKYGRF